MSQSIDIKRKIFAKGSFQNVVDTNFNELISSNPEANVNDSVTVDQFFSEYDSLFYSIPPSGSNSHLELVNRSSEYLGVNLLDLEQEIRNLREENVSLKNQLFVITNNAS